MWLQKYRNQARCSSANENDRDQFRKMLARLENHRSPSPVLKPYFPRSLRLPTSDGANIETSLLAGNR